MSSPADEAGGRSRSVGKAWRTFYHGARDAAKCRHSGFSGRIGIFELLVPSDQIARRRSPAARALQELRDLIGADEGYTALRHRRDGEGEGGTDDRAGGALRHDGLVRRASHTR
jgi:type II secretory ATPase GspE/PulE/Tfp pilus assembly ATPase PilB-like protein